MGRDNYIFNKGLSHPSKTPSREEKFLAELGRELEKQMESGNLSAEKISRLMRMSRSTFFRKFNEFTDTTPTDYIKQFQMEGLKATSKQSR